MVSARSHRESRRHGEETRDERRGTRRDGARSLRLAEVLLRRVRDFWPAGLFQMSALVGIASSQWQRWVATVAHHLPASLASASSASASASASAVALLLLTLLVVLLVRALVGLLFGGGRGGGRAANAVLLLGLNDAGKTCVVSRTTRSHARVRAP